MSGSDRPDETMDDGAFADAKPACRALVPQIVTAQWSGVPSQFVSRADPTFVTHLIATAEHVPQTRSLRRATPADAQSAYSTNQHRLQGAGIRARQIT